MGDEEPRGVVTRARWRRANGKEARVIPRLHGRTRGSIIRSCIEHKHGKWSEPIGPHLIRDALDMEEEGVILIKQRGPGGLQVRFNPEWLA